MLAATDPAVTLAPPPIETVPVVRAAQARRDMFNRRLAALEYKQRYQTPAGSSEYRCGAAAALSPSGHPGA
jgi:hypothetical protein